MSADTSSGSQTKPAQSPPTGLRPAIDADRDTVMRWRNHPEVRRVMFTDHLIRAEEHDAWWARVMASPDHRVLIIQYGGKDCGVVTFTRMEAPSTWSWGFYLDPDAFAEGADRLRAWNGMEVSSLAWAREQLQASEVRCEVFAFNTAVLTMHLRHRFRETGRYLRERNGEQREVVQLARAP
jgi:UDP-4-amino-4,6-dideoxy-N-acetyl-beta-L-altrosamine N-acetyltransferase